MTEPRPFLGHLNIVVRDMDAAVAFYRRLGVDIPDGMPEWDPHHRSASAASGVPLDFDSVEFAKRWDEATTGPACTIVFDVATRPEVDRVYADLTGTGYRGRHAPYDAFWGSRFAVVEDPDGNPVGLMSPVDAAMRRDVAPPS